MRNSFYTDCTFSELNEEQKVRAIHEFLYYIPAHEYEEESGEMIFVNWSEKEVLEVLENNEEKCYYLEY